MKLLFQTLTNTTDNIQKTSQEKIAIYALITIHFFGILGIAFLPTQPFFVSATPLSLIATSFILFYFQKEWNLSFTVFALITFLTGYLVEVVGVKTGLIFGTYYYGKTLGFKLFSVPIIIGVNWLMLTYSSGVISRAMVSSPILASFIGSVIMVGLDVLIEPVAIALDFWKWSEGMIPLKNYLGWFIISFLLQILFHKLKFDKNNILAKYVLFVQAIFFIILQIII